MEEHFIKSLIRQLPLAYALHKVVLDDQNKPVDYIYLDVNDAYVSLTKHQKKSEILHHRLTELLPDLGESGFDWVEFFGQVALNGEKSECVQYNAYQKKWYKVTAYSPRKGYFVSLFLDVTSEISSMHLLEKQNGEIAGLMSDLEVIFNSTQDSMFMVEYDGVDYHYVRCNRAFMQTTGYGQDILGKTPFELFGEESGKILYKRYSHCFESGESASYESNLRFPAGRQIWLTSLNPVLENGKVKYLVGSSKNITDYKKLEKERDILSERMNSMFSQHLAMMLIVDPQSGRILDANPSACNFYGYTHEELVSMRVQDINMLYEEDIRTGRQLAYTRKQGYFLYPHRLKNGEIRMVDVYSSPVTADHTTVLFSVVFDVTGRETMKEELYRERELLGTTLHSIGDGVVTTDINGVITSVNQSAQEITGWNALESVGKNFNEIFILKSEITGQIVENPVEKVLKTGRVVGLANHTVLVNKAGGLIPVADSAAPIKDGNGQIYGVVMVFRDVTSEKEKKEQILYLSYHDVLTGLYNRRFIEEEMKRADISSSLPLAVIMGDVNGLKITNDVFGHDEGDRLLQQLAGVMTECCREEDILCRWGGDEFLILMLHTTKEETEQVVKRIRRLCAERSEGTLQLSVSLGYSVIEQSYGSLEQALQDAEEWMYHQKLLEGKSYRNTVISTLLSTLYEKSLETEEHAERLKDNCCRMGRELHFTDAEMNELSLFAILHDIGKVGVDQSILKKPAPLSLEEWEEMRKHPEIGYRIAQNTPELIGVSEYILSHHERWDGSGYPRGLKGDQIPLMCRILSIADAFDAMTNDRAYRRAKSREAAIAELNRCAGTQFDPQIARIFVDKVLSSQ